MNTPYDISALVMAALQSPQTLAVRRRIIAQLIESLLYEGVIQPVSVEQEGSRLTFYLQGYDEQGQPVAYRCRGERKFSFGRLRLREDPVMRIVSGEVHEVDNIVLLLAELSPGMQSDPQLLVNFSQELQHTLLNDSIAQYLRHHERRMMRGATYDDLERETMDAHPYHPSYKSRIGFDIEDNLAYGPEFGPDLTPLWLAVHNTCCVVTAVPHLNIREFLTVELGDKTYAHFMQQISKLDRRPEEYTLIPVHPWQWRKIIVPFMQLDLQRGYILPLLRQDSSDFTSEYPSDVYRPQQSIRTLANVTALQKASLKLSLSIINTSTGRILAPHTVHNAPLVSQWLQHILAKDPFLRDEIGCILLGEVLGVSYTGKEKDPLLHNQRYGVLGCIWRESIHQYIRSEDGEEAIPFSSLVHLDLDGKPFIDPWIRSSGIEKWVQALLTTCIVPLIHLLYAHGVALESHAQNMLLVHRQGMPQRAAFKDFHDGIRFSRQHLLHPEECPVFTSTPDEHARINRNSFIETDDPLLVRDFMLDAFFFINIAELALFLNEQYGFSEQHFWSLARLVIKRYQQRFPHLQERFRLFDLSAPTIFVEQLTRRRLLPDSELRLHAVNNPLAVVETGEPTELC